MPRGQSARTSELRAARRAKAEAMAALFHKGLTLSEIGTKYGLTRERVRQIIKQDLGLTGRDSDGGRALRKGRRLAAAATKRDAESVAKHGCPWSVYWRLVKVERATLPFANQRANAARRGIPWRLNLWQWWTIWSESGHWAERGRGQGYCMARHLDQGAYEIGNVSIISARENSSREHTKTSGLPMGVSIDRSCRTNQYVAHRCFGGRTRTLGRYPTPEEAHAAYLAAAPEPARKAA